MPYSGSIQIANDANGVTHAFLADNGAIWQCQWNAEAEFWDQGQLVPQAFGGEKLQALYLDNLWPTGGESNPGFNPGIVLAYRIGEGSSAEIYASFGQWGGDGELAWSAPVQLTADQVDDQAFALVASPSAVGGFSLVVQKQEAGTPVNALLEQLATTPEDAYKAKLEAALSGERPDSDLYATEFNLEFSATNAAEVVLSSSETSKTQALVKATPEVTTAPAAAAFGGNTQLSRQELFKGSGSAASNTGNGTNGDGNAGSTDGAPVGFSPGPNWGGGATGKVGGGSFRYGIELGQDLMRWQLNIPANITQYRMLQEDQAASLAQDIEMENSFHTDPMTSRNSSVANISVDDESSSRLARLPEDKTNLSAGGLLQSFSADKNGFSVNPGLNFKWKGAFGIGDFGLGGKTSVSGAKLVIGYGTEDGSLQAAQAKTNRFKNLTPEGIGWNIGGAGSVQSIYQYSNNAYITSPDLAQLAARESLGVDLSGRYTRIVGEESLVRVSAGVNFGYEFSQTISSSKLPEWLAAVGYTSGLIGYAERKVLTGFGIYRKITAGETGTGLYSLEGGKYLKSTAATAAVGTLLSITGPISIASIKKKNPDGLPGASYNNSSGIQVAERLGFAWLYSGLFGLEGNLANRTTFYDRGTKAGSKEDTFFVNAGIALPLGGMIPLLSYGHTWGSLETNPTATQVEGEDPEETATDATASSKGAYIPAGSGAEYPFAYGPASGNSSYFSAGNTTGIVGNNPTPLVQLSLGTTEIGHINRSVGGGTFALTLKNSGSNLVDGDYKGVPILGLTMSGSADELAQANFSVKNGSIHAASFRISRAGTYLALPESQPNSRDYGLILDVYSTGIAVVASSLASANENPYAGLPLITVNASDASSPLSFSGVKRIETVVVSPDSQDSGVLYPQYSSQLGEWVLPASNNNALYTYSNVAVSVYCTLPDQSVASLVTPINAGVTATVYLSGGVIQRVALNEPIYIASASGSAGSEQPSYSIQLTLPEGVTSFLPANTAPPAFAVTPQLQALNNLVADEQFSAQVGAANTGVYLSAGLSDILPLYASMGSLPVQNRVTYVAKSPSGQSVTYYLNGRKKNADNKYEQVAVLTNNDLSLNEIYSESSSLSGKSFSAASTPVAVSIAGAATSTYANDPFVAWVEAKETVTPISTTSGGTENFQAFMNALYGEQQINYRIYDSNSQQWLAPNLGGTSGIYKPNDAVIRHLRAFNVADPYGEGQKRTLLVWSEVAIDAIKGAVESMSSDGSTPSAVLKAVWINPNARSFEWRDLIADANGNSTLQTIPWDPTTDVGLTIDDISIGSISVFNDGSIIDTPVVSWSQVVRTPYRQSVLNDSPYIYLQLGQLQSGVSDVNIGSVDSVYTSTSASATGLKFGVAGALPNSPGTAVQNSDGTGVLSTGMGTNFSAIRNLVSSIPVASYTPEVDPTATAGFTGSIDDTLLRVTALASGTLDIGDVISGPGVTAGTTIKEKISVDSAGIGTYLLTGDPLNGVSQTVASTQMEAIAGAPTQLLSTFNGSIAGTTLDVTNLTGSLLLGDVVSGEGITPGTTIIGVSHFDAVRREATYTVSESQTVPNTALVATPGSPTIPYTIEFWAKLEEGTNPNGAGLVTLGQPSTTAVGEHQLPAGWLLASSFVVDQITYSQASARGLIPEVPSGISDPSTTVYGWDWGVVADGTNDTAMGGNGGKNLYSNALVINNLLNGAALAGVDTFLQNYGLTSAALTGIDGSPAATIANVPVTQLQFSNDIVDNLPSSSLNGIGVDTSSAIMNQGFVSAADAPANSNLYRMFNDLWTFQQRTGEAKVNFSLAPNSPDVTTGSPPSNISSESYSGYELGFSLANGTAISVNGNGELVFDLGYGTSLTSGRVDDLPGDLRDGQWHYIAASYLPSYRSYSVAGSVTQVPSNVGTASLYVDNKLVGSKSNVIDAYRPINLNDQALLLANNQAGSIDQLAFYDKALTSVGFVANPSGDWPQPNTEDALAALAAVGYGIATKTPDPGAIPGAVTNHWLARKVNPNDALLGTYYSVFTPSGSGGGSWSEASNLNPQQEVQPTTPSAEHPGSLQDDLVISVPVAYWNSINTNGSSATNPWVVTSNGASIPGGFNPSHQTLTGVQVTLSNASSSASGSPLPINLTAEQVLLGSNTLASLQPGASAQNFDYTVLTNLPAFTLLIDPSEFSGAVFKPADLSNAVYTFNFTSPDGTAYAVSNANPVSFNADGAAIYTAIASGTATKGEFTKYQTYNSAIATAAVIESAPIQLKYIDSGEVFKSSSSTAAANTPSTSSPADTFGTSQVFGSYIDPVSSNTCGWLAIAQPQSTNASSDPAGRIWIQYTGQSNTTGTPVPTDQAPITWLNALADSNFSPDTANLPLLDSSTNYSGSGGLLIQADPTVGWGENFGQTMLVADVNGDGLLDLVIGAPQANGGGRVYVISGAWILNSLTTDSGATILNLANPNNLGDYVTVLTPSVALTASGVPASTDVITVAGFGSALAFDSTTSTLLVGAPNYLSYLDGNTTVAALQPIGALYNYSYAADPQIWGSGIATPLGNPVLGSGGTSISPDPTGTAATTYWGSQLGTAIAVDTNGQIAVSAPGVYAAMVYSGTQGAQAEAETGKKPNNPYGEGALVQIGLAAAAAAPAANGRPTYSVTIAGGTTSNGLQDVADSSQFPKNSVDASEASTYMQNLKKLNVDNIADATLYYNQSLQVNAVGAVYLFTSGDSLKNLSTLDDPTVSAQGIASLGGTTIYGPNPWNVLGGSGFGSSLAFGDFSNVNGPSGKGGTNLAIGADQVGGSGAVYLIDSQQPFAPSSLGSNQYLAHLVSGFTMYGAAAQDNFGNGLVSLGDVNNDGYDDLLIQAFNANSGAGNGYVLFGNDQLFATENGAINPGTSSVAPGAMGLVNRAYGLSFTTPILQELGYGLSSYTGQGHFGGSADVNGDGLNDLLLGSGPSGSAYLTWGKDYLEAIGSLQLNKLASNTGYLLEGLATTTEGSLRSIGDFNGDGYGDFISILPGAGSTSLTSVRIELGANTEEILADYPYNFYSFTVSKDTQVAPAGDINGDGFADISLFIDQDLSPTNAGAGSTTGILFGRASKDLPVGSGFGFLAPVNQQNQPLAALPGISISGGLSNVAPAMVSVGNILYSVVKGYDNSSLWFAQSNDAGNTWSTWTDITTYQPALVSNTTPSLAYYNNKLYLAFVNAEAPGGTLSISSWNPASHNPAAWSVPVTVANPNNADAIFSSGYTPQLIDNNDVLNLVWVDTTSGTLFVSSVDDSASLSTLAETSPWTLQSSPWTAAGTIPGSSPATPAVARLGDTIYMAVQGNGTSTIYWNSSSDGGNSWGAWQGLPPGLTSYSPPSLAVIDDTLYLSYIGYGNNSNINITTLVDPATNNWSSQYQVNQGGSNVSATYASLVAETVGINQQLAVYYTNSASSIYKAYSTNPESSSGWTTNVAIDYDDAVAGQSASGPLAVTQYQGQTYLAYQAGTVSSPGTQIVLATSATSSSSNTGSSWSCQGTFEPGIATGLGLTSSPDGLVLSYGTADSPNALQLQQLTQQDSGTWSVTDTYSDVLPSTLSNNVALLSLDSNGWPGGLLLAGIDTAANSYGIQTSLLSPLETYSNWTTPNELVRREISNKTKTYSAITASGAPSLAWLGNEPVLAVLDGGTINVYASIPNSLSWQLASSFTPKAGEPAICTAPVLAATETGLVLTYGTNDGSDGPTTIFARLDFLDVRGNLLDGDPIWSTTTLNQSNGGLNTSLATVPLSVNGNLLLANVNTSEQVSINAIPVLADSDSSLWLNSTVQLPDSNGGGSIGQVAGNTDWQTNSIFSGYLPSFAELNGVLYAVAQNVNDSDPTIFWSSSLDGGRSWQAWDQLLGEGNYSDPSLVAYDGLLYLAYSSFNFTTYQNDVCLAIFDPTSEILVSSSTIPTSDAEWYTLLVEGEGSASTLALYYTDQNSIINRTSTSLPPSASSSWSSAFALPYPGGSQTASGNLAATYTNGTTYVAYQTGIQSSPSSSIDITYSSNPASSESWDLIGSGQGVPQFPSDSTILLDNIGLTANRNGLVLSYSTNVDAGSADEEFYVVLNSGSIANGEWSPSDVATTTTFASPNINKGSYYSIFSTTNNIGVLVGACLEGQSIFTTSASLLTPDQTRSTLTAAGDLNNDGYDDLIVTANHVVYNSGPGSQMDLATGLRFISGAGNSAAIAAANDSTSTTQTLQLAPATAAQGSTPVTALSGPSQLTVFSADGSNAQTSTALLAASGVSASSVAQAQTLFSTQTSTTTWAPQLQLNGWGNPVYNTASTFGDLNGDGYRDYLAADGLDYIDTGYNPVGYSVWSIRAAGDVNGNGVDDVLLSLSPIETDNQYIQTVLVDGALFKITGNTFSLGDLRVPLDPYRLNDKNGSLGKWEGTSAQNDYIASLQNWLQPILDYKPSTTIESASLSDAIAPIAGYQVAESNLGYNAASNMATAASDDGTIFVVNQGNGGNNIYLCYGDPVTPDAWTQQFLITGASTDSVPGVAFFDGRLYVAYKSVSSSGSKNTYNGNGLNIAYNTNVGDYSSWTTYSIPGESSRLGPTLLNEDNRLAMYFASNDPSSKVLYLKSTSPSDSSSWGSTYSPPSYSSDGVYTSAQYTGSAGILPYGSGSQSTSTPISATRFQGKTVLAYAGGTVNDSDQTVFVTEEVSPGNWSTVNTSLTRYSSTPGLTADATQLYLTANGKGTYYDGYWSNTYSPVLMVGSAYNSWGNAVALSSESNSGYESPALANTATGPYAFWSNNGLLTMSPLSVTTDPAVQVSLAGYSIDGNIDVNGDGFKDFLVSDPTDPALAVDNQYVLFGGDYLDIASQVGTAGNDTLIGTPLADVIYTLSGTDEVRSNGGTDVIYTGSGDDKISIKNTAFLRIDAGAGFDQLLLEGDADQPFDFRLNFFGTKLRDVELINSKEYGSNTISLDAAAVNAANPDRILFLTPDAEDVIQLTSEFVRNSDFDTSYGGNIWYAYTAGVAVAGSTNPALVYVGVPAGESAAAWLATNVQTVDTSASFAPGATRMAFGQSEPSANNPLLPVPSAIASTATFGNDLTVTAYKSSAESGVARFMISRSNASTSQLVSYVSSPMNSLVELGSNYHPILGLLRLAPGEFDKEIWVYFDPASLSTLRNPTFSLNVTEVPDVRQQTFDLILQSNPDTNGVAPVLSDLDLVFDSDSTVANISFRADISKPRPGLADTYSLGVIRRPNAKSRADDSANLFHSLVISDGSTAKFDQDVSTNRQVALDLEFDTTTGVFTLQPAADNAKPLVLNGLIPATSESESGITYTTVTIDAIVTDSILNTLVAQGVQLNDNAIDYNASVGREVDREGTYQSSVYLDLSQVADSLDLTDGAGKRRVGRHLAYYGIDRLGALEPLTFNHVLKAGAKFFDTDGDGSADSVNLKFTDGGLGDNDDIKGVISDPSFGATADLDVVFTKPDERRLKAADPDPTKSAPASVVLKASLTSRAPYSCQIGILVLESNENVAELDNILADISTLRRRSDTLFSTLESSDLTLAQGTKFERDFSIIQGQQIVVWEIQDSNLDQLSTTKDSRFHVLFAGSPFNSSRSVSYSSTSGVKFNLDLVQADLGLSAMIAQVQGTSCALDLTALSSDQLLVGTVSVAREAAWAAKAGFYSAVDSLGTVLDAATGELVSVNDGFERYRSVALTAPNIVDTLTGLSATNLSSNARSVELTGPSYLLPYAVVNGNYYFAFDSLNPDGNNPFRMVGMNTFGFEDTRGPGSDRDYDDLVIGFIFSALTTAITPV